MTGLFLLVAALAGAAGASLRWLADRRWGRRGVLLANTAAAIVAGLLAAAAARLVGGDAGLLAVGALSSFVLALGTFSTVAAQAAQEFADGRPGQAARLWAVHLGCGGGAALLGVLAGLALPG